MNKNKEKYLYYFEAVDASGKNRKFCILKPTRKMKEDGEIFYASKLSQLISAGVLPKIVWDKIFKNNGGIISETDQKEYSDLFIEFAEYKNSLDELSTKPASERSDSEKGKIEFLEAQLVRVRKSMQDLEMAQVNAFENTAEAKARNKTIIWWAATLSVEENVESGPYSLLGNGSIEEKLDIYDSIVENDEFLSNCFSRLNYLITVWYLGSASTFEDFKNLDSEYVKRMELEQVKSLPEIDEQKDSTELKQDSEKSDVVNFNNEENVEEVKS